VATTATVAAATTTTTMYIKIGVIFAPLLMVLLFLVEVVTGGLGMVVLVVEVVVMV
jgi:hypothetical protein